MRDAMRLARGPVTGLAVVGTMITLGGCAQDAPAPATAPGTGTRGPDAQVAAAMATTTALWRDADPAKHPKGSCAGCHGADWFDLARIGTTDADLVRRAVIDGATPSEAQALVVAVREYRTRFRLAAENPRTFRPFQPGGRLLPGTRGWERDIAMGEQLERLLPTLTGPRIADLAMAKRARDEVADLLLGTNRAGANPERLHLRTLPVGVVYPRWSADVAHGADEGTLNDWVADLAFDPTPETRAEWRALVDAYIAEPGNESFWRLYAAVPRLLVPKDSTLPVQRVIGHKFRAALIGQHMLRMEAAGKLDEFLGRGVAFAALDQGPLRQILQPHERTLTGNQLNRLPSFHLWDVGDAARGYFGGQLGERFTTGLLGQSLADERAPKFVVESVDPGRTRSAEEQALRLAWFWIGFTFDPTLQRSGPSNSTKSAEYLMQSLGRERMFVHRVFMEAARAVAQHALPAAQRDARTGSYGAAPPVVLDGYLFFQGTRIAYERGDTPPAAQQERHRQLHATLLANLFRMNALLHLEGLANGFPPNPNTGDKYDRILAFLRSGEPEVVPADEALLRQVATAIGVTLP